MIGKKLIVIIPALNEEKTIASVIQGIPTQQPGISETEVIVIDDGSRDHTSQEAQRLGVMIIAHKSTEGVGSAFRDGMREALMRDAEYIVNIDADGQFNPRDIPKLLAPIMEDTAQFVTATRFGPNSYRPAMPAIKIWGNKWVTRIVNTLTGQKFTDVSCGFRAYSRDCALRLTLFGKFTYTQESFIDLALKGICIKEVPLLIQGEREHGRSRVASNLWRYAIKSATIMFRTGRDYKPFYFIGVPGIFIFLTGVAGGVFVLHHFIQTGQTFPYRSLVTISGILLIIGFLLFFMSMLADMQHRSRMLIEETLYLARKQAYAHHDPAKA